ncbi:MAG: ribonuclease III [Lachnospiraceae bacterium]|nr:ribonuclease III [Lachnospiraceae bacterium]
MTDNTKARLQETVGYHFRDESLLTLALTHSSYAHESCRDRRGVECNERLEFLGDAVLELITSEYLYENHGEMAEGRLSKLRASIVCEPSLAICARDIGLGECLRLGHGEELTGGRDRASILSDAFEAVIGAIYLDGGTEPAREFVNRFVLANLSQEQLFEDAKTVLQEISQQMFRNEPVYELVLEEGPAHCRTFTMSCTVDGRYREVASGHSKKSAEQACARKMLRRLREMDA